MVQVKKGNRVKIFYTGKLKDGSVFESNVGQAALEFTVGAGKVIKGFETAVIGMGMGQSKTVTIKPADAYGPKDPELVWRVERTELPSGTAPDVGQEVAFTLADGTEIDGRVVKVDDDSVTVDGNHLFAGRNLTFEIKIAGIG
jgi:peptidylprolyl isomerase